MRYRGWGGQVLDTLTSAGLPDPAAVLRAWERVLFPPAPPPSPPPCFLLSTGPIYSRAITVAVLAALAADLEHQHHPSTRQRGPTSWLNRPVPPPDDLSSDQPRNKLLGLLFLKNPSGPLDGCLWIPDSRSDRWFRLCGRMFRRPFWTLIPLEK